MKLREGESWMPADEYGRSLSGLGVNLLVADVARALRFQTAVLGAFSAEWMFHADHTYHDHPLRGSLTPELARGIGVELRLHGCDPDAAERHARELGYTVLAGAIDKPHGLREAYLLDADGYLWVPDLPSR